jgi:2-oxoisovalerate dehydrogenase E1 component alpha subunit
MGQEATLGNTAQAVMPASKEEFSLISNEKQRELYAAMMKCRMLMQRVREIVRRNENGTELAVVCHEAAAAALVIDLGPEDLLSAARGDRMSVFVNGADLKSVLRGPLESAGFEERLKAACETAAAHKRARNGKIVLVVCDDDAHASDAWLGALRSAAEGQLPAIFARHSKAHRNANDSGTSAGASANTKARAIPAIAVDGNDAVAIYRVASETFARARSGRGATVIECVDFQASSNDAAAEIHDAVKGMETWLRRKGLFSEEWKQEIESTFRAELDRATCFSIE